MSRLQASWLLWSALGSIVAVLSGYLVGAILRASVETGVVCFAVGCGWAALTPRVLRELGRRLR